MPTDNREDAWHYLQKQAEELDGGGAELAQRFGGYSVAQLQRELHRWPPNSAEYGVIRDILLGRRQQGWQRAWPAGPVRVDNRIVTADLPDGAKLLAALLAALGELEVEELAEVAGRSKWTIRRWQKELRDAGLEAIALERPKRRFVLFPRRLLLDPDLSVGARVTALVLGKCVRKGVAQVGQVALARMRGVEERTLRRHLAELVKRGYLTVVVGKYAAQLNRRQVSNVYLLTDLEGGG